MRIRRFIAAFSGAAALAVIGIAAPALSAQEEGRDVPNLRIPAGQRACSFSSLSFSQANGDVPDNALTVSHGNGSASRIWVMTLSSEAIVASGARINLHWRLDGGGPEILGPEFFAGDVIFQTRTALGIRTVPGGVHNIRPSYQYVGSGSGTVFFRCLTVEARTK